MVIAFSEALGTFAVGFLVCQAVKYSMADSLFLALAISVTSTVIVMRILDELGIIKDEASTIILGVAVIEDIIIISMLAILQSVSSTGGLSGMELVVSIGTVLAFIGGALYRFKNSTQICKFNWQDQSTRCPACCNSWSSFWSLIHGV